MFTFSWTVNGGGSISNLGVFISNQLGLWILTAQSGLYSGSTSITVINPAPIASISVTPSSVSLNYEVRQSLQATAYDSNAAFMSPQPSFTWSAGDCGSIDSLGVFTAGTTRGTCLVQASSGDIIGSATITIHEPIEIKIIAPVAGTILKSGTQVSVNVGGSSNLVRVEISVGNSRLCTDTAVPYSCLWNTKRKGFFTLKAVGYDEGGNSVVSPPVGVEVIR